MASSATQTFVALKEIRDGVAILKDGSMRAILMASSINFALKSNDEQQAILAQFQHFLNTLDFSLQFYIQSRELDINPYLTLLMGREAGQQNDLMRIQLREYISFIKDFTTENDIMTKSFFIIVPYSPAAVDVGKSVSNILKNNPFSQKGNVFIASQFEEHRTQLAQRIAVIEQGLARVGVRTISLETPEIVDLFYHIFNPYEGKKALPSK